MKRKRREKQKEDAEIFIRSGRTVRRARSKREGKRGKRKRGRAREREREKENWSRKRMNKA